MDDLSTLHLIMTHLHRLFSWQLFSGYPPCCCCCCVREVDCTGRKDPWTTKMSVRKWLCREGEVLAVYLRVRVADFQVFPVEESARVQVRDGRCCFRLIRMIHFRQRCTDPRRWIRIRMVSWKHEPVRIVCDSVVQLKNKNMNFKNWLSKESNA